MNLGQYITDYCEREGITVKEFAAKSGIDRSYIFMFKRSNKAPGIDTYTKAAKALGMTVEELMEITEYKKPIIRQEKGVKAVAIPVYTQMPLMDNNMDGAISVITDSPAAFIGYKVSDNEMNPIIAEGDTAVVRIKSGVPNGSIILAQYKGKTIIRQYYKESRKTILKSFNHLIPDETLTANGAKKDLVVFGQVIEIRRNL